MTCDRPNPATLVPAALELNQPINKTAGLHFSPPLQLKVLEVKVKIEREIGSGSKVGELE